MVLLNPIFLWLLLLLLIPVLIHLFNFRRIKTIRFSNVYFLQNLKKQNTPRKRVAEYLLLLTRLFLIGFLVLAFTGPIIRSETSSHFGARLFVVDNSYSLMAHCQIKDCLTEINESVLAVADPLEAGAIVDLGSFRSKSFHGRDELSSLISDISVRKGDFPEIIDSDRDLVVFSDFQMTALEKLELTDSVRYTFVPIVNKVENNVTIDSVWLARNRGDDLSSRMVNAIIRNNGFRERANTLVKLFADNQQIGSTAVTLGPDEVKNLLFAIEDENFRDFRMEVNDRDVPFDNDFYFTLPRVSRFKVCSISDKRSQSFAAVFGNESLFQFSSFTSENIDFEQVFDADALVLNAFNALPTWFDLDKFQGVVIIIPGDNISTTNYSERLGFRVLPATDTTANPIRTSSLQHPFFDGIFDDLSERVELPMVRPFYKSTGGDVLLDADQPFLKYYEAQGVYMFEGPLTGHGSRLTSHSIFLPLMYRIVESSKSYNNPLSYELNENPISLSIGHDSEAVPVLVNTSGRFIPEFSYSSSGMVFTLPYDLNEPGIYYLMSGSDTLSRVALNYPRSETRMNYMMYEELVDYFEGRSNVNVIDASSPERLKATMDELKNGTPLWKYALILALMFLLAETAIHRWLK